MLLCVILFWPSKIENSLYFMQNMLEAREFKENYLNILILGKLDSKHVILKSISSHTHAFCSQNSMLWGVSIKFCFVFQKSCFQKILVGSVHFNRSNLFFYQSKLHLKFLSWFCVFRSIENRIESFWNTEFLTCSSLFKLFQKHFLSLFDRFKGQSKIFVVFDQISSRFLSSDTGKTFIPLLFHLFSFLMHFFHAFKGDFRTKENLGFLMFSFKIDRLVFLMGCY